MGSTETREASPETVSSVARAFARRLKEWRMEAGLPLKHVARDLGVSVSIVCEWEHAHRFPSFVNLEGIARCMGLPVCCVLYHGRGHCPHGRSTANGRTMAHPKPAPRKR
jgi:ribosome-binding protein aMBF1 (putative translation factor)